MGTEEGLNALGKYIIESDLQSYNDLDFASFLLENLWVFNQKTANDIETAIEEKIRKPYIESLPPGHETFKRFPLIFKKQNSHHKLVGFDM